MLLLAFMIRMYVYICMCIYISYYTKRRLMTSGLPGLFGLSAPGDHHFHFFSAPACTRTDFEIFWCGPWLDRRSIVLALFQKPPRKVESINPVILKGHDGSKKHDFWGPFGHPFLDFFRKCRKCVISEEYNAKRGSRP